MAAIDSDLERPASGPLTWLWAIPLVAGAYFASGKLGLEWAFVHESATAVWPPTGIALAAFLLLGYRVWPGVFLGAFFVNLTTEGTVATSLGIAMGNTLEGVAASFLVNRFSGGLGTFETPVNVVKYVVLAGILSPTVSATIGVSSLAMAGFAAWHDFGAIWFTWWLGDMAGALIVGPFLLLWAQKILGHVLGVRWEAARVVEATALGLALAAVAYAVFFMGLPAPTGESPYEVLVLPLVVWAALRFEQLGASTLTLILSVVAIGGTLRGLGPFVRPDPNESLLLLQVFMGTISATSLLLAGVVLERRRAQDSLARARDELDRKVRERTRDLERALEELQSFSYSVSHDLRAPLRAIDAYAQELLEENGARLDPDSVGRLHRLKASSKRMADLIEALLRLARLGRAELRKEPTSVSQMAHTTAESLRAQEPGRAVRFIIQDGLEAQADPRMLEVALENLLGNAWKFTRRQNQATISVGRVPESRPPTFFVRDDGAGFPQEFTDRLFRPFGRLHKESDFPGTGIGLVVTQRIIQRHGGRIWAEGATGKGATFYFTLAGADA